MLRDGAESYVELVAADGLEEWRKAKLDESSDVRTLGDHTDKSGRRVLGLAPHGGRSLGGGHLGSGSGPPCVGPVHRC